jgi:hypothetical protein
MGDRQRDPASLVNENMSLLSFCHWIEHTPGGVAIRESQWLFATIITVHVLSLGVFLGTVVMVDLRLLGTGIRNAPVSDLVERLLPWTRGSFVFMAVSGVLLIWSEAVKCYQSPSFRIKLALIFLAGINLVVFHNKTYRTVAAWDQSAVLPWRVRLAGALSLLLWIGTLAAGRAVGYNY